MASEINKGSCFTLSLDVGNEKVLAFVNSIDKPKHHKFSGLGEYENILTGKVLLAEDNEDNQNIVALYIRKAGAEITIANNGKEAVEFVNNIDFDLILMDMQMPIMNGLEATKIIRAKGFKNPIVALTANVVQEYVDTCLEAGCSHFLSKPIDRKVFFGTLENLLSNRAEKQIKHKPIVSVIADDPDLLFIIEGFIKKFPSILEKLSSSYQGKDWTAFQADLHNIKGSSGNMGFMEVSQLAEKMMQDQKSKYHNDLEKDMQTMMAFPQRMSPLPPS